MNDSFYPNISKYRQYDNQHDILFQILQEKIYIPGFFLELGVGKGSSINFIAQQIKPLYIYGFDNFTGYPEAWRNFSIGNTSQLILPTFEDNVIIRKGFFKDSLPLFKREIIQDGKISFLHLDCSLYSSNLTCFTHLESNLISGSIIVITEGMEYDRWEQDALRAFREFLHQHHWDYEVIGYNSRETHPFQRIAFRLKNSHLDSIPIENIEGLHDEKIPLLNHIENQRCNLIILCHQKIWVETLLYYIMNKISSFNQIYLIWSNSRKKSSSSIGDFSSKRKKTINSQEEIDNLAFYQNLENQGSKFFKLMYQETNQCLDDLLFHLIHQLKKESLPCFFIQDTISYLDQLCIDNFLSFVYDNKGKYPIFLPNLINGGVIDYLHQRIGALTGTIIPKNGGKINRTAIIRDIHSQVINDIKSKNEGVLSKYGRFTSYLLLEKEKWTPLFFAFYPQQLNDQDIMMLEKKGIRYLLEDFSQTLEKTIIIGNVIAVNYCLPKQRYDYFDVGKGIIANYIEIAHSLFPGKNNIFDIIH